VNGQQPVGGGAPPRFLETTVNLEKNSFRAGRIGRRSWRAGRYFLEFLGFESLEITQPAVTVFGSARFDESSGTISLHGGGGRLAEAGYAVTGGGPGVMEAANRGPKNRCLNA
jgi:hypothetical protein